MTLALVLRCIAICSVVALPCKHSNVSSQDVFMQNSQERYVGYHLWYIRNSASYKSAEEYVRLCESQ